MTSYMFPKTLDKPVGKVGADPAATLVPLRTLQGLPTYDWEGVAKEDIAPNSLPATAYVCRTTQHSA